MASYFGAGRYRLSSLIDNALREKGSGHARLGRSVVQVSHGQTLFSHRGVIACSVSAD